ncbi:mandelate racemase/muconate lactonizing enzyme family protein [Egbenema bharatensis]|uniref:mandelate racemase/muconate lactonizing enzyme family protein n=1 Tax=Egbenema bharatensis TaxID=3463334 RepID=UPI003A8C13D5
MQPASLKASSPLLNPKISSSPVRIASIELLHLERTVLGIPVFHRRGEDGLYFIRTRSTDGRVGLAVAHERIKYFYPILKELVIPYFVGKDARDLESLIDGVYTFRSNYKLSGLALWCCVAWVEYSLLDLLGKVANQPIGELLGGMIRSKIPVYLSSLRRDTTPEEEVDWVGQRLAETQCKAVKFKIGGRMSNNADAMPERTERLIQLARKTYGDQMEIYADANGSYDAATAIEVGKFLESEGVSFFEEPCPFDEWEDTQQVADALSMAVAGGEQETSLPRFQWMMKHRTVDLLQPDLTYNGGFLRTMRVVRAAKAAKIPIAMHNARLGVDPIYMLHFASCLPTDYQEYNARPQKPESWFTPDLMVKDGSLSVPTEPGLGIQIDPAALRKTKRV